MASKIKKGCAGIFLGALGGYILSAFIGGMGLALMGTGIGIGPGILMVVGGVLGFLITFALAGLFSGSSDTK